MAIFIYHSEIQLNEYKCPGRACNLTVPQQVCIFGLKDADSLSTVTNNNTTTQTKTVNVTTHCSKIWWVTYERALEVCI